MLCLTAPVTPLLTPSSQCPLQGWRTLSGCQLPNVASGRRYHRWLGHAVMVMVTAHSLGFWGIWLYQGQFVQEAFDQGRVFNK
jgi:hypothetical protein